MIKKTASSNTIVSRRLIVFIGVLIGSLIFGAVVWGQSDTQEQRPITREEAMAILRSDYFDEMDSGSQTKYQIIAGEKKIDGVIKPFDFEAASRQNPPKVSFFPFVDGRPLTSPFTNVLLNNPGIDVTVSNTQSETAIVLGAGNNIVSGSNDSGSYAMVNSKFTGYSTSSNSGGAWTDRGELATSASGDAGDPVMARNNTTGTILLATLSFNIANQINIYRSTDNGVTFGAPINGTTGTVGGNHDKEWLAVDNFAGPGNGNAYLFWRDFGSTSGMRLTRSTDDGVTWALAGGGVISTGTVNQGAQVAVGSDHSVYLEWLSGTNIVIRRSTDLGVTFGAPVTVTPILATATNGDLGLSGGFRTSCFPQLIVNPVNGNLYTVYPDDPAGTDKADIFFRQSTNNGATWSSAVRVNLDPSINDQWQPALAVSPDGTALFVGYYDRRRSPTNNRYEYWGRTAAISGSTVTFGCEFPIGSTDSPVVIGADPVVNSVYMGDYDTVTADNTNFYSNSADNRSGNADSRNTVIPKAGLVGPALGSGGQSVTSVTANSCNPMTITVQNYGCSATAGSVTGTLSTATAGVTIQNATQSFGTINGLASASNATPFQISVASNFACGTTIAANLTMSSGEVIPINISSDGTGNYNVSSTNGPISATGTLVPTSADDDLVVTTPAPFAFSLYGNSIASGQVISLSTNGTIQIVASGGSNGFNNTALPATAFGAMTTVLMPYWDDLDMRAATTSGGGIFTETTGVAPNRTFKVEWRARHYISGQALGAPDTNFAAFFHEGSNSFEYVYATAGAGAFANGVSATVGAQAATTGTSFTQFSANTASLSNGLKLNFVQPLVCAQGTGSCAATSAISGTVTYGNSIGTPAPPRFVKNVSVGSTAGSPSVGPVITGTPGTFTLTGFGAGSYTIRPTKPSGLNSSITSNDAARVAQGVANSVPFGTLNQKFASDASGNGIVSSTDAALIARFAAGLTGTGNVGQWKFFTANLPGPPTAPLPTPPYNDSRSYASVSSNVTGEDYVALLIGEASGNYNPATHPRPAGNVNSKQRTANSADGGAPEKPITVAAQHVAIAAGKEIVIPVNVEGVTGKKIISYEFDLRYDPAVIQPFENAVDVVGTVSRGLMVVTNPNEPGLLRVVVYGPMPIDQDGVLLNLRFTAVGPLSSVSPLTFEWIMFNEGEPRVNVTDGMIELF